MSQTVARRIPIGPVQVYLGTTRLGTSKSSATLNWSYDVATGTTGDNVATIIGRKTNEQATMEVTISDLKASQLMNAMDQASSLTSVSTLMTNNYLANTTLSIRRHKELMMSCVGVTTGVVSLPSLYTSDTVNVYSLDYETEYVVGTDFALNTGLDGIYRKTGSTILTNAYVMVHFDGTTTCSYVRGGGADTVVETSIRLVGVDAAGKYFQFTGWRAIREGAMNITVNADSAFPGTTLTFRLLASTSSYTKGSQLFEVAIQS